MAQVLGDFVNKESGYLYFDFGGVSLGDFDLLRVHRNTELRGVIRIVFRNGFAPAAGDVIPLILFPESGASITIVPQPGKEWEASFEFANLTESPTIEFVIRDSIIGVAFLSDTTFVPEPATINMLSSLPLLAQGTRRRRKRQ